MKVNTDIPFVRYIDDVRLFTVRRRWLRTVADFERSDQRVFAGIADLVADVDVVHLVWIGCGLFEVRGPNASEGHEDQANLFSGSGLDSPGTVAGSEAVLVCYDAGQVSE